MKVSRKSKFSSNQQTHTEHLFGARSQLDPRETEIDRAILNEANLTTVVQVGSPVICQP